MVLQVDEAATRNEGWRIAANIATSRESDSIGLAGSIDSAAPTARRYQMTRRETPIVVPHDWGLSVVFGQIKMAPTHEQRSRVDHENRN